MVYKNGQWIVDQSCNSRTTPIIEPKEITAFVNSYIPFDKQNERTWVGNNLFGWTIHQRTIKIGKVYPAYDGGKRLVVEVGCDTVIYIQINPSTKATHHRFFIQPTKHFFPMLQTDFSLLWSSKKPP